MANEQIIKLKEGIYWTGKRIIYPLKKDMKNPTSLANLDWKNVLGIRNFSLFLMTALLIISLVGISYAYQHDTKACFDLIENPQLYCNNFNVKIIESNLPVGINLSKFNVSELVIEKDGENPDPL